MLATLLAFWNLSVGLILSEEKKGCSSIVEVPQNYVGSEDDWNEHARGEALAEPHEIEAVRKAIAKIARWESRWGVSGYDPAIDRARTIETKRNRVTVPPPSQTLTALLESGSICREEIFKNDKIGMRTYKCTPPNCLYIEDGVQYEIRGATTSIHIQSKKLEPQGASGLSESQIADLATMLLHESAHVTDYDGQKETRSLDDREVSAYGFCSAQLSKVGYDEEYDEEWLRVNQYILTARDELTRLHQGLRVEKVRQYPAERREKVIAFLAVKGATGAKVIEFLAEAQLPIVRRPADNGHGYSLVAVAVTSAPECERVVTEQFKKGGMDALLLRWTVFGEGEYPVSLRDCHAVVASNCGIYWIESHSGSTVIYHAEGRRTADMVEDIGRAVPAAKEKLGKPQRDSIKWGFLGKMGSSERTKIKNGIADLLRPVKQNITSDVLELTVSLEGLSLAGAALTFGGGLYNGDQPLRPTLDTNPLYDLLTGNNATPASSE